MNVQLRAQAVGLAALALLYYDFQMIQYYLHPFFWAFMICLFLKRARDIIVNNLDGFVPTQAQLLEARSVYHDNSFSDL